MSKSEKIVFTIPIAEILNFVIPATKSLHNLHN